LADTSDNCELSQSITQLPAIGSIINSDTIITLTALDASGNSSSCNFRLILNDTTAPGINCPIDQNDNYNENCQFILLDYTSLADTSDNCELVQSISQIPATGTIINSDTTLITLTSTDLSGNLSSCEFYLYLTDTTNPIITCPSDTIMDNDTLECGVFYNYLPPVGFDNCNSIITQNIGLSSGSLFPVGFTTNIFRITDEYGNYSSCSFYVLVNDVDPPLITCPNDTSIQFDNSCKYIIPNYLDEINFSDNCGIRSTFQSPIANSLINNDFSASIVITDSSGNASQCNFNVSLFDPNIQDIICPNDQNLMLGSDCKVLMPNYTDQLLVPSLCGSLKTIEQFPIENSLIDFIGSQEVLFNVTDSIGNVESCSFKLSITNNDINNCNKIFIPNVFSPDGDLINDLFVVYGLELNDQYIEIYNRWGQMVYKSELSNVNWDGKFQDENVPSGTYVYSVFKNDGELKLKGTISLVR
jgi:gliding motility-associated-like protein